MKKIVSMVLVLLMAAALFAISASADESPFTATITNAKSYYQPGDSFEIVISKTGTANVQGVTQKVKPNDSAALTWNKTTCVNGDMFESKSFGLNLVFWDAASSSTGTLVTIPVTVAETATLGTVYTIDLSGTWTDGEYDHEYAMSLNIKVDHDHSKFATKVPAKAKSCTAAGNTEYYECSCGKLFTTAACTEETTLEAVTIAASHEITHKTATAATCSKKGNIEYWECTECHTLFSDALGNATTTKEAVETAIDSTNHTGTAIYHAAVPNSCTTAGSIEYYECPDCHEKFTTAAMSVSVSDSVIPATNHAGTVQHVDAGSATCAVGGHGEYWHCTKCDKYFNNADCAPEHEIPASSINVGALGHEYTVTWEWASDNKSATATFTCSVCNATESGHVCTVVDSEIDVANTLLPTCAVKGTNTLTASVEAPENTKSVTGSLSATKTVDVDPTGEHTYGLHILWIAGSSAPTASYEAECSVCHGKLNGACDVAVESEVLPTCVAGYRIYKAEVKDAAVLSHLATGVSYTDTKRIELAPTETHDLTQSETNEDFEWVAEVAATKDKDGMKGHWVCKDHGTIYTLTGNTFAVATQEEIDALTIKYTAPAQDDSSSSTKKTSPKTGDSNNIVLWTLVLTVSAVSVGAVLNLNKKSKI